MFLCEIWSGCIVCIFSYDRVEVLSGFINGLFLIVIGIFVFTEALGRLVEPPEVSTERLLVSINVWCQKNMSRLVLLEKSKTLIYFSKLYTM